MDEQNSDSEELVNDISKSTNHSFDVEIRNFIQNIESLESNLPLVMLVLEVTRNKAARDLEQFLESKEVLNKDEIPERYGIEVNDRKYQVEREEWRICKKIAEKITRSDIAYTVVPRSFIVSLISQFDAYIGRLIRTIFYLKPEILNTSEKNISFSNLLEFESIEDAREFLIEKEVEAVLRQSHAEQFKWFENKLEIPLKKALTIWSTFIEVTERRNLFVHCDGVISTQYIKVCELNKALFDKHYNVGDKLEVTPKYFQKAYQCIFEIGVKLAHVIWRKLQPDNREKADKNLINITYNLIVNGEYELANILLDFATNVIKKHSSEEIKLMFFINKAQSLKWSGDEKSSRNIVSYIDWSACSDKFKLASAVLTDNFDQATRIMKRIGKNNDEVSKEDYKEWPLFKEFIKSEEFLKTYEEVFQEPFLILEKQKLLEERSNGNVRESNSINEMN